MTLSKNLHLGNFEVSDVLGRGGMGEVWRAVDTKLGREVALKALPEDFADNAERHARFEREAKVLASLNHPSIATLYGLEHLDGKHILVMELVEGEGLDDLISGGPVGIDEAISSAIQMCEALESAHEAGIVHRDLKPANIMVKPDGTVKILDFGLAKTWEDRTEDSSLSMSPTMTAQHTAAGVILGTAAYMSPEQARGKPVDSRTDIWAFGVVLWEMLTGCKLFQGETVTDVMASVLRADINLDDLPLSVPPELRRLVRRCLEREPKNRLRDIGDARITLQEILAGDNHIDTTTSSPGSDPLRNFRRRLAWIAGIIVVSTFAAVVASFTARRADSPFEKKHLTIMLQQDQRLITDGNSTMIFHPEENSIVFTGEVQGRQMLLRRALGENEVEVIKGTEGGQAPFISPDGRWLGFIANNRLMKVPINGGTPYSLADCQGAGGATWLPDDTLVFTPIYSDGLFHVPAEGGETKRLTTPDRENGVLGHWWPEDLPGARWVIFTAFRTPVDSSRIGLLDLRSLEIHWIVEGGYFGRYSATGHLLYVKGHRLFALALDPESGAVTGPPVAILGDLRTSQTGGFGMFAMSRLGDLAYVSESHGNPFRELVWLNRTGRIVPAATQRKRYLSVSLAPDEQRAAVTIQGESRDLWTYAFDRGTLSRLTSSSDTEFDPTWSVDGREIFYVVDSPPFELYRIGAGSSDTGRPIWEKRSEVDNISPTVSPDGIWLAFVRSEAGTRNNIYVQPIEGKEPALAFRVTNADELFPTFSPDGRWLAYQSDETGRSEIYVEQVSEDGERFQITGDGGTQPLWSRKSGSIIYRHHDEFRVIEARWDGTRFAFGSPETIGAFAIDRGSSVEARTYAVTADGERILAVSIPNADLPRRIEIITNFVSELKRLAP